MREVIVRLRGVRRRARPVRYSPEVTGCYRKMIKQKVELVESLEGEISRIVYIQ